MSSRSTIELPDVNRDQVQRILEKSCWSKSEYSERAARRGIARWAARGETMQAYRCAITGGDHWHIGHPMGVLSMLTYAAAMRWCWDNPDGVPHRDPQVHPQPVDHGDAAAVLSSQ